MKKIFALALVLVLSLTLFAGCTKPAAEGEGDTAESGVSIRVATTMGGDDWYRQYFDQLYPQWEAESGNTVINESARADDAWKLQILADFETGSEADVLFFFNGADANPFIEAGKVVSIADIQAVDPEYGANILTETELVPTQVDGNKYALSSHGFWETIFVNEKVLKEAGVSAPTADTTWEEFMTLCQAIKDAGYTPIAMSLGEPHYIFECLLLNNEDPANHFSWPADNAAQSKAWADTFADITDLYNKGYFSVDADTNTHLDACEAFYAGDAAFLFDGSWRRGSINTYVQENEGDYADYGVCFVPSKGGVRKNTDIIGGLSSGWYITKKAWDDPAKRDAAISFVKYMTSDSSVNMFAEGAAITALRSGTAPSADPTPFDTVCVTWLNNSGVSSTTGAFQDTISSAAKDMLLTTNTVKVVKGDMTVEESIEAAYALN